MPYLLQSLMSCWAMVVKGQMTTIVEPVKVKFKYSKQVLTFYTRRKEKKGHQHGQGLPIASWQGSQQVIPGFAICHSTDQVDLLKKNSPSKFLLFICVKNNLEITEIRGESRMMHPEPFISAKHSFSLPIHH